MSKVANNFSKLNVEATGRIIKNILCTNSVDKFNSVSENLNQAAKKIKKEN